MSVKKYTKKGGRKGPGVPAKDCKVGCVKKGMDGKMWVVKTVKRKDGKRYKVWKHKASQESKSKPKSKKRASSNPWIRHVKKYAKAHGCSYMSAMKRARKSYKPRK